MTELPKITFQILLGIRLLFWTLSCLYGEGIVIAKHCNLALGMESGKIKDEQLSASSSFDWKVVGPQNSRIRHEREGGAWCPANPVSRNSRDWLEIDLIHLHKITGVEVQGRFGRGQGQEFMEWFTLEYKRKNTTPWIKIDQVFPGNSNTYAAERRNFGRPVVASLIRFFPVSNHSRTVCLRVEVYGCQWLSGLLHYNLPQGHSINLNVNQSSLNPLDSYNLTDAVYDGQITRGILEQGIGYLVDGDTSVSYQSPNKGWLGWKREELNQDAIWIEFVFDGLRCFNHADVVFLDEALKQAGVFERVALYFAIDQQYQISRKLTIATNIEQTEENVRVARIQIDGQAGRSLKVFMFPRFDWLLISEVSFSSYLVNSTDGCHYLKNGDSHHSEISFHVLFIVSSTLGLMCIVVVIVLMMKCLWFKTAKRGICKRRIGNNSMKLSEGHLINRKEVSRNSLFSWSACRCNGMELNEEMTKNDVHSEILPYFRERMIPELPQVMDWSEFYEGTHKYTKPLVLDSGSKTYPSPSSPSPLRRFYPIILYHEESHSVSPKCSVGLEQKSSTSIINSNSNLKDLSELINISVAPSPKATNSVDRQNSEECISLLDQTSSVISMSKYFLKSQESLVKLPRDKLICLNRIGEGLFGEICLCEMANHVPRLPRKRVILKLLRDEKARNMFIEEAKVLANLRNRNIVRLVGVCFQETPNCLATEYLYFGDLKTFLQQFTCITIKSDYPFDPMSRGIRCSTLLYFGHQITCGMAYLEEHKVIHRDLAARNCLVGRRGLIKISDFCMSKKLYNSTFYQIQGVAILPIRWMAWESVLLGIFSSKSDVWSFGVTLWEVMTLGKIQPYEKMSDEEIIENCQDVFLSQSHPSALNFTQPTYLERPSSCSEHLYELMLTCWKREVGARPRFSSLRNKLFKLYDFGLVTIDLETSSASWSPGCQLNRCFSSTRKSDTEFDEDSAVLRRINSVLLTSDDDNTISDNDEY